MHYLACVLYFLRLKTVYCNILSRSISRRNSVLHLTYYRSFTVHLIENVLKTQTNYCLL